MCTLVLRWSITRGNKFFLNPHPTLKVAANKGGGAQKREKYMDLPLWFENNKVILEEGSQVKQGREVFRSTDQSDHPSIEWCAFRWYLCEPFLRTELKKFQRSSFFSEQEPKT